MLSLSPHHMYEVSVSTSCLFHLTTWLSDCSFLPPTYNMQLKTYLLIIYSGEYHLRQENSQILEKMRTLNKINIVNNIMLKIIFYGLYCEPYTLIKRWNFGAILPGSRTLNKYKTFKYKTFKESAQCHFIWQWLKHSKKTATTLGFF